MMTATNATVRSLTKSRRGRS